MMTPEELTIYITDADSVSARLYSAARGHRAGVSCVLAHGAGADQLSGFMQLYAGGLSERGLDVLTFNFLYKERGKGVPDPKAKLEACYQKVIEATLAHKKLKSNRLVIGGKSMGGRIASQVAAALAESGDPLARKIDGLIFLGYPLHPPGNPAKLRTEHLKSIPMKMLFVQGTRDSLGTPDEIRPFIKKLNARIHVVEGGDHSFKAPKSAGLTQQQVHDAAMDTIVSWCKAL
jgi:predicted alpha/beta-hydrolase family hydrolase